MQHVLRLTDRFEIGAEAARPLEPSRVLKHGDTFTVFNHCGDMIPSEGAEHGLFHDGTRYLSRCELMIGGGHPLLLSSTISDDNLVFTADLTNADVHSDSGSVLAHGNVHVFRSRLLHDGGAVERFRVSSFARHPIELPLALRLDADFADIFEVRGTRRPRRGERLPDVCDAHCILRYLGLDGVERRTRIRWSRPPVRFEPGIVVFMLRLDPRETGTLELSAACEQVTESRPVPSYDHVIQTAQEGRDALGAESSRVTAPSDRLECWIRRSTADLDMMMTAT
ncbi:MAG: glycogen debranching N-terminal domain-containing protein, partial [Vicinamibacterales bacterium]